MQSNPFPSASDLDQDAFAVHAFFLVQRNKLAALLDRGCGVKAQASCDFRRDAARHNLEDLASKQDEEAIDEFRSHCFVAAAAFHRKFRSFFHQAPVNRHLGCVVEQGGIGGGVLRTVVGNGVDIARIGHHGRILFQRFEQRHDFLLGCKLS